MARFHSFNAEQKKAFGTFIKNRCKKNDLIYSSLASILDVSPRSVAAWACGECMPKDDMLGKICDIFDENVIVVGCVFGYPEYVNADYWLGKDYNKDSRYINLYNECFVGISRPEKKSDENPEPEKKERKERKMAPSYAALLEFGKQLEAEEAAAITDYCKNDTEAVVEAAETIGNDPEYTRMFDISESKEATEMLEHNGSIFSVINDILVKDGISIGDGYDGKINSGFSVNGVQVVVDLTAEEIAEFIKTAVKNKVKKAMSAFMED